MTLVPGFKRRRRDVVASAPDLDLGLAVFRRRLRLVQALQSPVVTPVEPPVLLDREPELSHFFERQVQRPNGPRQQRCERDVEIVVAVFQQAARLTRFLHALFGQVDVGPARETVLFVPGAFAVSEQNEFMHRGNQLSDRMALRPANAACAPSSSSMRISWLYLQIRSVRLADPVLI